MPTPSAFAADTKVCAAVAIAASAGSARATKVPNLPRVSTMPADLQLAIGARHRVDRHAQLAGQFADRGQPGPRRQPAVPDSLDDLRPELVEQRPCGARSTRTQSPKSATCPVSQTPASLVVCRVTVLSGAGISAESGVPTFRDVETGLWAKVDPYEISSADGWRRHPEKVWAWYLWRHYMMRAVQPNDGHRAVAAWQDYADVHVVTQNVDNLHERAGSKQVYHLHGSLFEFRCDRCQYRVRRRAARHAGARRDGRPAAVFVRRPDPARTWCGSARRCPTRRGSVRSRRSPPPTS